MTAGFLKEWKYFLLSFVIIFIFLIVRTSNNQVVKTVYSTYCTDYYGAKAYLMLLKKLGYDCISLNKSLLSISKDTDRLIILSPQFPFEEKELQFLMRWAESGKTVIIADNKNNGIFEKIGVIPYASGNGNYYKNINPIPSNISSGVEKLRIISNTRLQFKYDSKKVILLIDEKGILIAALSVGNGVIVVSSVPEIFTNGIIKEADNCIYAVSILKYARQNGKIEIDEFHHGFKNQNELADIVDLPTKLFIIQLFAIIILVMVNSIWRFGSPVPVKAKPSPDNVSVISNLYLRADIKSEILIFLYQNFRKKVLEKLGLPSDSDSDSLINSVSHLKYSNIDDFAQLISDFDRLDKMSRINDKKMIDMAKRLEKYRKEILTYGK